MLQTNEDIGEDIKNNIDKTTGIKYIIQGVADAYIKEVYFGVCSHYDELVEKITAHAEGFSIDRIFKVDLAILLLAVYDFQKK